MKLSLLMGRIAVCTILAICAVPFAVAAPLCPTAAFSTSQNPAGNGAYIAAGGGCNEIITIFTDGSINTAVVNPNPYDGLDDELVGVVNNSSKAINNLGLSSPTVDIFGFDGDGICAAAWSVSPCNSGTFGYEGGVGVSFSGINAARTMGTVNFTGGLGPGSQIFFSLEGFTQLNVSPNVPEPGPAFLVVCGLVAVFLGMRRGAARR